MLCEVNFDGLVGPTHHFGGLGVGNIASQTNRARLSRPREAALEGLNKAWLIAQLGVPQILLPPLVRPHRAYLSALGVHGTLAEQLKAAYETDPQCLSAAMSASAMWSANAATVSPAPDTTDGKLHITPANLISSWHRAQEAQERGEMFGYLWRNSADVAIHDPLPSIVPLRDEGAANHLRLSHATAEPGIEIFVSGDSPKSDAAPRRFMIRQTWQAGLCLGRAHRLYPHRTFHLQQSAAAIDAGVFHNDVISTAHEHLWFMHEEAFECSESIFAEIETTFRQQTGRELRRIVVKTRELSIQAAVQTYLFNSQIVTLPKADIREPSRFHWIAPQQCQGTPESRILLESWQRESELSLEKIHFVALRESMANGGGPACLRLRIPLDRKQLDALPPEVFLDAEQYNRVHEWIVKWYPECLALADLTDINLVEHLQQAVLAYPYRSYFVRPTRHEFNSIKLV
jgi:succinylarginine dihydrolase